MSNMSPISVKSKRRKRATLCRVCRHPDRVRIEANRLVGVTCKDLAAQFGGVSAMAIWRHMHNHVSAEAKAELMADVPLRFSDRGLEPPSLNGSPRVPAGILGDPGSATDLLRGDRSDDGMEQNGDERSDTHDTAS